jgi:hypothetical protein
MSSTPNSPRVVMAAAMHDRVYAAMRANDRQRAMRYPTDVAALAHVAVDALTAAGWALVSDADTRGLLIEAEAALRWTGPDTHGVNGAERTRIADRIAGMLA